MNLNGFADLIIRTAQRFNPLSRLINYVVNDHILYEYLKETRRKYGPKKPDQKLLNIARAHSVLSLEYKLACFIESYANPITNKDRASFS